MKLELMKKGLLRQNVYLMAGRSASETVSFDERQQKYCALVRETVPMGVHEKIVEMDYPVTRESVKSYLSSCDYKSDPLGSVSARPAFYGDIRDVQKVAEMDMETARSMYRELSAKIRAYDGKVAVSEKKESEKKEVNEK